MTVKFNCGDHVEWSTPRPHNKGRKAHKGTVIEVVAAGSVPTKAGNWLFTPRDHESYVVQDEFYTSTFWPRILWFTDATK